MIKINHMQLSIIQNGFIKNEKLFLNKTTSDTLIIKLFSQLIVLIKKRK